MPDDKKVPGGRLPKVSAGATGSRSDNVSRPTNNEGVDRARGQTRARNQDVLPGILGKQLKAAYSELLNAPVPDAITQLIKELESKQTAARPKNPDKDGREENGQ